MLGAGLVERDIIYKKAGLHGWVEQHFSDNI